MKSISISQARNLLLDLPDRLKDKAEDGTITVTKRGKPVLAIMSYELYDSIIETLEIISDPEMMSAMRQSIEEIKEGKTVPWEKVKKELSELYDL